MVTWSEDFDVADGALTAVNGWLVVDDDSGSDGLETYKRYATNADGGRTTVGYQQGTGKVPTGIDQKIAADVLATVEHASSWVRIGVGGKHHATYSSRTMGLFAQLTWGSDSERVLTLGWGFEGSIKTLATLTMVAQGGVLQTGYTGYLVDQGLTGVMQRLRLIVTETSYGLLLRAYVNNEDDDQPTLEAKLRSDWIATTAGAGVTTFGAWWLSFGPNATARSLVAGDIAAEDYSIALDRAVLLQRQEQVNLGEIKLRVLRRYGRSVNTNIDTDVLNQAITDALDEIMLEVGDQAWFAIRTEELLLTADADGLATMPAYVERLIEVLYTLNGGIVRFEFVAQDDDGNLIVRLPHISSGYTYRATFVKRFVRMSDEADQCILPRKHTELLVLGAARRLAELDPASGLQASFDQRYALALTLLMRDMANHSNAQHRVVHVGRRYMSRQPSQRQRGMPW